MKRIVLSCFICILLSACVKDDMDDCGAIVRLIFTHEHSIVEFDQLIANDVHLQIYQNERLIKTEVIPYETIQGGQEYILYNYDPGIYSFVAWAVPRIDSDTGIIPAVEAETIYSDVYVRLSRMDNITPYYQPIGEIFLGEEDVTLIEDESSRHEVSLSTCIARVYFTLYGADLLMETKAGRDITWIELAGTRTEMCVDRTCGTDDAVIYKPLTYTDEKTLFSDVMGVLPSEKGEYLSVTMYKLGEKFCQVDTDIEAEAGQEIWIDATIGQDVIVYVNGWRVKNASITFF